MFLTWPYLWEDPITRFVDVFRLMSDNPTTLSVLYGGDVYRAGELPRTYMPFMLGTTFTEPVWFLFFLGVIAGYWKFVRDSSQKKWSSLVTLTLTLSWFIILLAYVLIRKPAMYDGIRHFLFIVPPIFIFCGFAFEWIFQRLRLTSHYWLYARIIPFLFLLPGLLGIAQLHPYEYTYYNSFIGGTSGAFRRYETDFWLTCYKEAVAKLNETLDPINLYVHREAYIAEYYASEDMHVFERREAAEQIHSGDYILVNTRTNEDRRILNDVEPILTVQRGQALFCTIKRVP
jgi:hypothetical protein